MKKLTRKLLNTMSDKIVILAIRPKYADLILSGKKRVEFRRTWAACNVREIVFYASSPVQKIVGIATVSKVCTNEPGVLWDVCEKIGCGLTENELYAYFSGKDKGVAVFLDNVVKLEEQIEPSEIFEKFYPPQSFRYMSRKERMALEGKMTSKKGA